jgi:nicotinamidase-related amidase
MIRIDAKPYAFEFDPSTTALVIIDMQRDFVLPGGFGESLGNDVKPLGAIVPRIQALLTMWRGLGSCVVHTREAHLPDLSDCPVAKLTRGNPTLRIGDQGPMGRLLVRGEYGSEIIEELKPALGEILIDKPGKGAFYQTKLLEQLKQRGITHLIFTGVTTEVCVQTSMREANDRGFECLVVEDATESYFPQFKLATLEMIVAQAGIVGWSALTHELLHAIKGVRDA